MTTSGITHYIIVPENAKTYRTTYFQGYSTFWHPLFSEILRALIFFPHDISDIYLRGENYVRARAWGAALNIKTLRADLIEKHLPLENNRLLVFWSSDDTAVQVEKAISQLPVKPIHISTSKTPNATFINHLNKGSVKKLVSELLLRASTKDSQLADYREFLISNKKKQPKLRPMIITAKSHNCTDPLLGVLITYGASIKASPIKLSGDIKEHVISMLDLASRIDRLRPQDLKNSPFRKNDVIVYCQSSYTFLYRADSKHWRDISRQLNNPKRNFLRNALIRSKGYGNSPISISKDEVFNPYEDEILGTLLRDRQAEIRTFTSAIAIVASNQFIPALRLPNAVMLHHDRLRDIGRLINSNDKNWQEKLSKLFSSYSETIKEDVGPELMDGIFDKKEKILAVCDFPLEWFSSGDLPAMFKYELSRIPSTPGNVTNQVLLSLPRISYPYKELCNVLIIRSFDEKDHIKYHLSKMIDENQSTEQLTGLTIKLVDVSTKEEMIDALIQFSGNIVIFDCHGGHGGETDTAWLTIGGNKVDVWHIYQQTRVPPIVILAACSTHPVEGSHASVANGFLESGAYSVLGTFAPINSVHAATFVTRLLARIAMYLPLALKLRPHTWREVITGLFRMSYVTDVLIYLSTSKGMLSQEQYKKIHEEINASINFTQNNNWFENLINLIAVETNKERNFISSIFQEKFQFVETMLMVQLGRPENIMITLD